MARRGIGQAQRLDGARLGKRLKKIRTEKKISTASLAVAVGVQENYIRQLEIGCKTPSFDTLIALINALQVTADELLFDYVKATSPEIMESYYGKLMAQIPEEQRARVEAHIMLEIQNSK